MGKEATSQITMDEAMDMADLPPEKQGTAIDRKDMHRMGKQQVWAEAAHRRGAVADQML